MQASGGSELGRGKRKKRPVHSSSSDGGSSSDGAGSSEGSSNKQGEGNNFSGKASKPTTSQVLRAIQHYKMYNKPCIILCKHYD
jgi:hypothetical protein